MISIKSNSSTENAFLVGAIYGSLTRKKVNEHLDELSLLSETAGANIVHYYVQRLNKINPAFFIGPGKAKQIIEHAKSLNVSLVIFDDELSLHKSKTSRILAKVLKLIEAH